MLLCFLCSLQREMLAPECRCQQLGCALFGVSNSDFSSFVLRGNHSGQRQTRGAEGIVCWIKPEIIGDLTGLQLGLLVLVLVLAPANCV